MAVLGEVSKAGVGIPEGSLVDAEPSLPLSPQPPPCPLRALHSDGVWGMLRFTALLSSPASPGPLLLAFKHLVLLCPVHRPLSG